MIKLRSCHPNRSVVRFSWLTLFFVAALTSLGGKVLHAQRVVMVYEEPRHRVVHQDGDLKLLDVQILPGDTTMMHTHDSPILYTFISSGNGPSGGRVQSITSYATEHFTHEVTNPGPNLFRIIALAHYGPGEAEGVDTRPDGVPGEPQLENDWFRSWRIELAPGEQTALHRHRNPVAIVQVGEGRAEVSKENGFDVELIEMGQWTWRDAESPYTVFNAGSAPLTIVVNEARRTP